ncbi:MAG: IS21/IS408/IS1162 family transposase [Pseudonocardiaceae bacterium]
MVEVREVLRGWLAGKGLQTVGEQAGVDRKTARRYVAAAREVGLVQDGGEGQLTDELIGQVVAAVRPVRRHGHGASWDELEALAAEITEWVGKDLTVVKIADLLARRGVVVPYRTLHRFCVERAGYHGRGARDTVRINDGEPGQECQVDFAKMGLFYDPSAGRRRTLHVLIFTAVVSRHMFVWLTFTQTLEAIVAGCEAGWRFFGGVFKVLVVDNTSAIVAHADATNPRFTVGWLEYAQARGFVTDPARVRSPQDKPRVQRVVQYVRGNFFAGESFIDLADAQSRAETWCRQVAGLRMHGTIQARPAEVFAEHEAAVLLPAPQQPYLVPIYTVVTVHRDHGVQIDRALYSAPKAYLGQQVHARADAELVKLFHRGQLIKTHPRQRPGGRSTDPDDLPAEKVGYAMRDLDRLIRTAAGHGPNIGIYAERLLDDKLPWTRMRQVYRLLGLAKRYGADPTDTACGRALELDVVSVTKIASMLERATENTPTAAPRAITTTAPARFARDPGEYRPVKPYWMTVIDGGQTDTGIPATAGTDS